MSLPGWSGHVQYRVREKSMAGQADDSLAQLLAIRLAYDLALFEQAAHDESRMNAWQRQIEGFAAAQEPDFTGIAGALPRPAGVGMRLSAGTDRPVETIFARK